MKPIITIPLDVPAKMQHSFRENYQALTRDTGSLFMMAADQRIEHLGADFFGNNMSYEILDPEHLFSIAHAGHIGCLATHMGILARYAQLHDDINYIIKLNGKTNLNKSHDPISKAFYTIQDIITFKQQNSIKICGIGYTVYLGSEYEAVMLKEAAELTFQAHQQGLVSILWMYPRSQEIINEKSGELIVGAAGVGLSLGADFVKINMPENNNDHTGPEWLALAQKIAGNTKIVCSGGPCKEPKAFLSQVYQQLQAGSAGAAIGRNIFQHTREVAIKITRALEKLIYQQSSLENALKELEK